MEFRNQFLHNIECSSFENAVKLLGPDKEKKLLKFDDADENKDKALRYKCAFINLYRESLKIMSEKTKDRKNQIQDRSKTHSKLIESQVFYIDKYFGILDKILLFCENNVSETSEVIQLTNQLCKIVTDDMEMALSSEKFTQIENELKELHTPERIKAYFKR